MHATSMAPGGNTCVWKSTTVTSPPGRADRSSRGRRWPGTGTCRPSPVPGPPPATARHPARRAGIGAASAGASTARPCEKRCWAVPCRLCSCLSPKGDLRTVRGLTVIEDPLRLQLVAGQCLGGEHLDFQPDPKVGAEVLGEPHAQ